MSAVVTPINQAAQGLYLLGQDYFWLFILAVVVYVIARTGVRSVETYIAALLFVAAVVIAKTGFAFLPPWIVFVVIVGAALLLLRAYELIS